MNAFVHEPRERLSDRERTRLFLEREGRCHRCTRKITAGETWIDEHLVALENGGSNEWSNRVLTCLFCKPAKDGEDHRKAAHAKRVAVKHVIPTKQRQKRAGFRGWRKFSGEPVWRTER